MFLFQTLHPLASQAGLLGDNCALLQASAALSACGFSEASVHSCMHKLKLQGVCAPEASRYQWGWGNGWELIVLTFTPLADNSEKHFICS